MDWMDGMKDGYDISIRMVNGMQREEGRIATLQESTRGTRVTVRSVFGDVDGRDSQR